LIVVCIFSNMLCINMQVEAIDFNLPMQMTLSSLTSATEEAMEHLQHLVINAKHPPNTIIKGNRHHPFDQRYNEERDNRKTKFEEKIKRALKDSNQRLSLQLLDCTRCWMDLLETDQTSQDYQTCQTVFHSKMSACEALKNENATLCQKLASEVPDGVHADVIELEQSDKIRQRYDILKLQIKNKHF